MKKTTLPIVAAFCVLMPAACACQWEYSGCTLGTPGVEGEAVFYFDEASGDVSEPTGSAFCAGTTARMDVRAYDAESPLPPWGVESGDESVISVDEIMMQEEYPVLLGMRGEGISEISVVRSSDGEPIDHVILRVAEPEGLRSFVYHPFMDRWNPETVLIPAGTGTCYLNFYPYDTRDGADRILHGSYEIATQGGEPFLAFDRSYDHYLFGGIYEIEVSPTAEGGGLVTFRGPRNLEAARSFRTVTDGEVDGLRIGTSYFEDNTGYVGESGRFDAVQSIGEADLCGGFAVSFESSNPAVLQLVDFPVYDPGSRGFVLLAAGTATVTATLVADPALTDSLTFAVLEFPDEN